jgi:hypothetical protein
MALSFSCSNPVAYITKAITEIPIIPAPVIASFSSRGPSTILPSILKVCYFFCYHYLLTFNFDHYSFICSFQYEKPTQTPDMTLTLTQTLEHAIDMKCWRCHSLNDIVTNVFCVFSAWYHCTWSEHNCCILRSHKCIWNKIK